MMISAKKILLVAGARPNFMKIAPLWWELKKHRHEFCTLIIHTGQHYDFEMSDLFLRDLELPKPDRYLGIDSGGHHEFLSERKPVVAQ